MKAFLGATLLVSFPLGLTLILSLVRRKKNILANRCYCVVLGGLLFTQVVSYLAYTRIIFSHPYLVRLAFPVNLLFLPFFYLYVCALTVPGFRLEKKHRWHPLPCALGLAWYLGAILFLNHWELWHYSQTYLRERNLRNFLMLPVFAFYFYLALTRVNRYQKDLVKYFSELQLVRLQWLKLLLWNALILAMIVLVDAASGIEVTLEYISIPWQTVTIYAMAFFTLRQSAIFTGDVPWDAPPAAVDAPRRAKMSFSEPQVSQWTTRLLTHMAEKKPYLNPDLRLNDLSTELKLKPYQLSEILKRGPQKNFFEFINRYRIEEAKKRFFDPSCGHMNLLGIANESGFNSKSVFNATFKKMTGFTPSGFRTKQT